MYARLQKVSIGDNMHTNKRDYYKLLCILTTKSERSQKMTNLQITMSDSFLTNTIHFFPYLFKIVKCTGIINEDLV